MAFLDHILRHRSIDLDRFVPVRAADRRIGWTKRDLAKSLSASDTWQFDGETLMLNPALGDFQSRSDAVHQSMLDLSAQGVLPMLPDYSAFGGDDWFGVTEDKLFQIHRFYCDFLGIQRENVMVHGFEDNNYWAAVRSNFVDEGKGEYDVIVAGAIKINQSPEQAVLEEGAQECALTKYNMEFVKPVSKLNLVYQNRHGYLSNEIFHVYDFDTKGRFMPQAVYPLEVSHFDYIPFDQLMTLIDNNERFKAQPAFMIVDFLIRHQLITQSHKDYNEIVKHLSNPYPFP